MTAQIWDQLAAIGKSAPWAWDELPPLPQGAVYTPALGTVGAAIYTFTADQMRAYAAAAVARERYKWELLTNQVLSDAEAQGVLSEWWEPMQAAIRKGG